MRMLAKNVCTTVQLYKWAATWQNQQYRSNFGEVDVASAKNYKVNKVEKWQKLTAGLNPNHMHIFKPWKKRHAKLHKDRHEMYKELCLQGNHCLYTFYRIWGQKMIKFTKWKKWQKLIQGLYPNHMHISRPWKKHVQSFIKIGMKLYEELRSQGTHYLYTFIESEVRNDKVHKVEKVTKINSRVISKPHAHLQTMGKTCAKFQNDQYKIVWGVALTRYPLSIHWGRKVHKVE